MIKLPAFISNGMVIGKKAKLWGWTAPGQSVNCEFLGIKYNCLADESGRFEFTVFADDFGGPHSMVIGDTTILDVYVGRVWLCGGQSNMEGPLSRSRLLHDEYVVSDPRIRVFQVQKGLKFDAPAEDVIGNWSAAEGDYLDHVYAAPYFFARRLLLNSPTPIGLLCCPAGGTPVEGWLPEELLKDFPELYSQLLEVKEPGFIAQAEKSSGELIGKWKEELAAKDIGLTEGWHLPDFDDSGWESRMLFDGAGLPEHGAVWYRKRFDMPKTEGAVKLRFGRAENSVKVYVNGTEVTAVEYMYPPCAAAFPDGVLKPGENIIAVRVVGESHNPRFVPGKEYAIISENGVCDLSGEWKRRVGAEMPKGPAGAWFYGRPCGVYNYMMAPLLGYSVEGMIWYQGESNTGRPGNYKELFSVFVNHVRAHFGENLPIITTQLANYIDPGMWIGESGAPGEHWAKLREEQRKCLEIPHTAMAVAIDCGEWNDLHPLDKKSVGERLALHALRMVYGEDIVSDGPTVEKAVTDGDNLIIHFKFANGLWAKNGHPMLDIIDENGNVHRVYALVRGETLVARLGGVKPDIIRFGWVDAPAVYLYNAYGLPASPFECGLGK